MRKVIERAMIRRGDQFQRMIDRVLTDPTVDKVQAAQTAAEKALSDLGRS